jgi:hypothetical protein
MRLQILSGLRRARSDFDPYRAAPSDYAPHTDAHVSHFECSEQARISKGNESSRPRCKAKITRVDCRKARANPFAKPRVRMRVARIAEFEHASDDFRQKDLIGLVFTFKL